MGTFQTLSSCRPRRPDPPPPPQRYHTHAKRHPHSLINRIVGAHELSLYGQRVRVMVVESCFQASREVHERYDLKGSWVGRGGKMLKSRGDVLKD